MRTEDPDSSAPPASAPPRPPAGDAFTWEGTVELPAFPRVPDAPRGAAHPEMKVRINLATGLELPTLSANDPLPEVGPVVALEVAGVEARLYRYVAVPRGLRALYRDRSLLATYAVYLERGPNRYLFRLEADQQLLGTVSNAFRAELAALEAAYEAARPGDLAATAFLRSVDGFLRSRKAITRERRLFFAEVAAEVDGELHFLHHSEVPGPRQLQLRLPARPGARVQLAARIGSRVRRVYAQRLEERSGTGLRGHAVALRVPDPEGGERRKRRSDREGWVDFPEFWLAGPRALVLRLGDDEVTLVLRWGRPREADLDHPTPRLGGVSTSFPPEKARAVLLDNLVRSWNPDHGLLRDVVPGQSLDLGLANLEPLLAVEDEVAELGEFLGSLRRRLDRRGRRPHGVDPLLAWILGRGSARSVARHVREELERHEVEPCGLWTQDHARFVQGLMTALRSRATPTLARLGREAAQAFAERVEMEPEPTWRYRAMRRPVKTFRANPDVAQPHAEALLALVRAGLVLPDLDWLGEVAVRQAEHLVEHHPLDGEPPAWVLGSWKDRALLETPARLGLALECLAGSRRVGDLEMRVGRLRRLVWRRFLLHYQTVEIRERVLLLRWLGRAEWALASRPAAPRTR